jgi:hypothetical protein
MSYYSTRQVAKLLGISPACLTKALWDGRVDSPQKSPSGNFLWTIPDIEAASWRLGRNRDFEDWRQKVAAAESALNGKSGPVRISEILPGVMRNIRHRMGQNADDKGQR